METMLFLYDLADGSDLHAAGGELRADIFDEFDGRRVVTVDTDGVSRDFDLLAGDGRDLALGDHADGARDGLVLIVDDGAGQLARHKRRIMFLSTSAIASAMASARSMSLPAML